MRKLIFSQPGYKTAKQFIDPCLFVFIMVAFNSIAEFIDDEHFKSLFK
jgi:hypothetical protein